MNTEAIESEKTIKNSKAEILETFLKSVNEKFNVKK